LLRSGNSGAAHSVVLLRHAPAVQTRSVEKASTGAATDNAERGVQ
jgi:hypothetical protein